MKPFAAFIKMQLNVNFGVSALKYRLFREKKKRYEPVLIILAIVLSLIPLLSLYTMFMSGVFAGGLSFGQPEIVLAMAIVISQVIILFFGLFYIMGTFYFSKDLEFLVPLPLKPYEIIGGKFIVIMINEYLTSMPVLIPPVIIYGIGMGEGALYWIKAVLILLTAPVIPLALAAVVIVIMMRFVNFRRHKDLFAIIGGLLSLAFGVGISMVSQYIPEDGNQEFIRNMLASQTGMIDAIGRRFPPGVWATMGLANHDLTGFGYLLLYLAAAALLFVFLLWLANKMFFKTLLAGQESGGNKKELTAGQRDRKITKTSGFVSTLMKREWKLLFRTPIYMLNGLAGTIMGPIILFVMLMTRKGSEESAQLFEYLNNPDISGYVLLGTLGLMLFTAGMNTVASTALSREGQTFWITKSIPVPAKQQVTAKLIISFLVSALGVFTTSLIMLVSFNVSLLGLIGITIVGLLGAIPMAAISLLIDVYHPKLVWSNEQEAMKQNMNGLFGMLTSMLIMIVFAVATIAMMVVRLPMWFVFTALGILSLILGVLSVFALYAVAEKKYLEHEA